MTAQVPAVAPDIRTAAKVLELGLLTRGYTPERNARNKQERLEEWFQTSFGCSPVVASAMWNDLQTTTIAAARIGVFLQGEKKIPISIYDFLNALEFLKCYLPERNAKECATCQPTLTENAVGITVKSCKH